MKKVAVIYFTQTGQLLRAVKATLAPLEKKNEANVSYYEINPKKKYPYPWSYLEFFDVFPDAVNGVPCELDMPSLDDAIHADLVVIAYQPWFLSVCIPINSFLQTDIAKKLLANKNIVTVVACRNMWLNAQEKMKVHFKKLNANLVGHITYVDKASNLVSLVTVLAFALKGVQGKYLGFFPKYGVSDQELQTKAPEFGSIISKHLAKSEYSELQNELVDAGAVQIKSNLMLLEKRGMALFPLYANYVSKKGTAKTEERRARVRVFGIVLPTAIFILSPIITIVSRLVPLIFPGKIRKEVEYYSHNSLR